MVRTFVDTSAWFALIDQSDPNFQTANIILKRLESAGTHLLTSEWVLMETVALARGRLGKPSSFRIGNMILDRALVQLAEFDGAQREKAWEHYLSSGSGISLVDCGSFVLMEELGITEAFAFDEDFEKAGFKLLRA